MCDLRKLTAATTFVFYTVGPDRLTIRDSLYLHGAFS